MDTFSKVLEDFVTHLMLFLPKLVVSLVVLLLRDRPDDLGLTPYGGDVLVTPPRPVRAPFDRPTTVRAGCAAFRARHRLHRNGRPLWPYPRKEERRRGVCRHLAVPHTEGLEGQAAVRRRRSHSRWHAQREASHRALHEVVTKRGNYQMLPLAC